MSNFIKINQTDYNKAKIMFDDTVVDHIIKRKFSFIEQILTINENGYACLEMLLPMYDKYTDSFLLTRHTVYSLNRYFI